MANSNIEVLISSGELVIVQNPNHVLHSDQKEFLGQELISSFETPRRVDLILRALAERKLMTGFVPEDVMVLPTEVHELAYLEDFRSICASLTPGQHAILPSTWPSPAGRVDIRHPPEVRLGAITRDSFTSIGQGSYDAALSSMGCVVAAFNVLLARGKGAAFALSRPPHHHAGRNYMNGYCYFNGTALAAIQAHKMGLKVAVVDVDFHHGNGTQDILYEKPILFCSIHGDPRLTFPFFSGFVDETGIGAGEGYNINIPLGHGTEWPAYDEGLDYVERKLSTYCPDMTIVSLGVDTFVGDPLGRFKLNSMDFFRIGNRFSKLGMPILFVMEGGYAVEQIGENVANVLSGFLSG